MSLLVLGICAFSVAALINAEKGKGNSKVRLIAFGALLFSIVAVAILVGPFSKIASVGLISAAFGSMSRTWARKIWSLRTSKPEKESNSNS